MSDQHKLRIAHFDLDKNFSVFFREEKYFFPLTIKNLSKVKNFKSLNLVTIKSNSKINLKLLNSLPSLKAIVTRTVGVDHIDLFSCQNKKIAVYHIPNYGAFAIAEHIFAMLLSQTRRIIYLREKTRQGKFIWQNNQGYTLKDKILGVVGVGKTGKETVKIATGFQMKVLGYDQCRDEFLSKHYSLKYVSLEKILKYADIISLNLPLSPKTYHLIGEKEIKKMKKGVILVNVSRGEIIDTQALVKYLPKFKYICLDVLENEDKYNFKNPLIKKLASSSKVLITPHVAFYTDLNTKEIAKITYKNIDYFLNCSLENRLI